MFSTQDEDIEQSIEDILDYISAIQSLNDQKNKKTIPLEDVLSEFKDEM